MSTINNIGIPGVREVGIMQPRLKHKWRVVFTGMGGEVDSRNVSAQAVTIERPKLSYDEVELHRYNSRAWIAGKHNFEPISVTIEDDISGTAAEIISKQQDLQQFLIGAEGQYLQSAPEGKLYKFITTLQSLDGSNKVVESWVCEGCWLQNTDWGDMDYATSEAVQITLTIRFDHARQIIHGYKGQAGREEGQALGGVGPEPSDTATPGG